MNFFLLNLLYIFAISFSVCLIKIHYKQTNRESGVNPELCPQLLALFYLYLNTINHYLFIRWEGDRGEQARRPAKTFYPFLGLFFSGSKGVENY